MFFARKKSEKLLQRGQNISMKSKIEEWWLKYWCLVSSGACLLEPNKCLRSECNTARGANWMGGGGWGSLTLHVFHRLSICRCGGGTKGICVFLPAALISAGRCINRSDRQKAAAADWFLGKKRNLAPARASFLMRDFRFSAYPGVTNKSRDQARATQKATSPLREIWKNKPTSNAGVFSASACTCF